MTYFLMLLLPQISPHAYVVQSSYTELKIQIEALCLPFLSQTAEKRNGKIFK